MIFSPAKADFYDIIKNPVITEKSTLLSEYNKHVFVVDKRANKSDISQAVEAIFAVKVKSVNIINCKGKKKTFKGVKGVRASYKKALVTLQNGSTLDLTGKL